MGVAVGGTFGVGVGVAMTSSGVGVGGWNPTGVGVLVGVGVGSGREPHPAARAATNAMISKGRNNDRRRQCTSCSCIIIFPLFPRLIRGVSPASPRLYSPRIPQAIGNVG